MSSHYHKRKLFLFLAHLFLVRGFVTLHPWTRRVAQFARCSSATHLTLEHQSATVPPALQNLIVNPEDRTSLADVDQAMLKLAVLLASQEKYHETALRLPPAHRALLHWLVDAQDSASAASASLSPAVKFILKKAGLGGLARGVCKLSAQEKLPMADGRQRATLRSIIRCASEMVLVLTAYQQTLAEGRSEEFFIFLKPILETVPVQERQPLLLVLCRGLLPLPTTLLAQSFETASTLISVGSGSSSLAEVRCVYPLLEITAQAALRRTSGVVSVDTGVAGMVASLALLPDGSGYNLLKVLRRWLCDTLLQRILHDGKGRPSFNDPTALLLQKTSGAWSREVFQNGVLEVGGIVLCMVDAVAKHGANSLTVLNKIMCGVSIVRLLSGTGVHSVIKRRYEQALLSPSAESLLDALEGGLAAVLDVDESEVRTPAALSNMNEVLINWKQPHLLVAYLNLHRNDAAVSQLFVRFLRCIFGVRHSGQVETLHSIRCDDPVNRNHTTACGEEVSKRWIAEQQAEGVTSAEDLFMMGEDMRSCMAIQLTYIHQNRALLGFVMQGNVRLIVSREKTEEGGRQGRLLARAAVRLLLRSDTNTPVLLLEDVYTTGSKSEDAVHDVKRQAHALADRIGVMCVSSDTVLPHSSACARSVPIDRYGFAAVELIELSGLSPWVYSDASRYTMKSQSQVLSLEWTPDDGRPPIQIQTTDERIHSRKAPEDPLVIAVLKVGGTTS